MRLSLISDLHIDANDGLQPSMAPSDICVIAGDVSQLNTSLLPHLRWLICQYPHVVFVTGNHEYYGSTKEEVHDQLGLLSEQYAGFHWLNNSTVTIHGQRFVGTTLWYPPLPFTVARSHLFTDARCIKRFRDWWGQESTVARQFLETTVQRTDIVVTHHAPSFQSVTPQYRNSLNNGFYVTDMEGLIGKAQPKIWHHGHMHSTLDYQIGETRVICNPYGYRSQNEIKDFNPSLIIEI